MKTLYLHIGTPKTGTTSIQSWLAQNQKALNQQSYYFPKSFHRYEKVGIRRNGHFLVGHLAGRDLPLSDEDDRLLYDSLKYIVDSFQKYDSIILTDEHIWWSSSYDRTNLWDILREHSAQNNYTIKLIIYLRRQDQFLASRYNQMIKRGKTADTFEEYIVNVMDTRRDVLDYKKKLDDIAAHFGTENVIVRRFARESFYNGNLYSDFIQALNLEETDDFITPAQEVNTSLPFNLTEIKRIANAIPGITTDEKWYFRGHLVDCSQQCDYEYPGALLSAKEAQDLLDVFRSDNETVAAKYIGDGKPLFDYTVSDLPKYSLNNPYMTEDAIRFFCTTCLSLYRENQELRGILENESKARKILMDLAKHPISTSKVVLPKIYRKYLKK